MMALAVISMLVGAYFLIGYSIAAFMFISNNQRFEYRVVRRRGDSWLIVERRSLHFALPPRLWTKCVSKETLSGANAFIEARLAEQAAPKVEVIAPPKRSNDPVMDVVS